MNLVTLEAVSKQYAERNLLDAVDLLINRGERIGLIGVNGSGKSTLLKLIAGEEGPDDGRVNVWGGVRVRYLPQDPPLDDAHSVIEALYAGDHAGLTLLRDYHHAAAALQARPDSATLQTRLAALVERMDAENGWAAEAGAKALLTRLGVTDVEAQVATLSGGQRKRVALANALLSEADLLILDEPTNHLDAETLDWLEGYLRDLPGALLMVTHDRYFLDRVVNRIVELDRRKLVSYAGSYSDYLQQREERHERLAAAEDKRRNLLRRELEWLRRGAQARSTKQKARKQRIGEMQRIHYDSQSQRVTMTLAGRRLGKTVLEARGLHFAYGDTPILDGIDLDLRPGDRIGIIGPNGAGKTTLLDVLAGRLAPQRGSVRWGETVHLAYYDQQSRDLPPDKRVVDFIIDTAPLIQDRDGNRIEAPQMLEWFMFNRKDQQTYVGALSGGEQRRLYLLHKLALRPNVLFLDEPTNDLDIQTLNVVEDFLDQFGGALIVVSHDRYFLDRSVDYLLHMDGGQLSGRYPAPFESYLRLREANGADDAAAPSAPPPAAKPPPDKPRTKLSYNEQREYDELSERVDALETRLAELDAELAAGGDDYQALQAASEARAAAAAELAQIEERWLELAERASD